MNPDASVHSLKMADFLLERPFIWANRWLGDGTWRLENISEKQRSVAAEVSQKSASGRFCSTFSSTRPRALSAAARWDSAAFPQLSLNFLLQLAMVPARRSELSLRTVALASDTLSSGSGSRSSLSDLKIIFA